MTLIIVILLGVSIALPLLFAWQTWSLEKPSRASWLISVGEKLAFVVLIGLVGRWDIAGIWTRMVLAALFVTAVIASWRRHAARPWRIERRPTVKTLASVAPLAIYFALFVYVIIGLLPNAAPHDLRFPLRGDWFVIAQGGDNRLIDHHNSHPAQRHAADITAVGPLGFRSPGILPPDPARYRVYGADVVSPCDGEVRELVDGLSDLPPPTRDPENPAGNHIVIACDGIEVTLAHLSPGSPTVDVGDMVQEGQSIARVGNSGNSTEPHLHIHAADPATDTAVAITFDGRTPFRNRLYLR
ncbi:M23 family metallopeptidase [Notoacmeibacter marinus]|uniref:M23 family metallopeptidase n=1 Tax=Notoacmeibacter marinus TaxID=1876515 RepID=UPI000DF1AB1E|nr:M23 family metallopeptidase [Notoacmeibacter marinus]